MKDRLFINLKLLKESLRAAVASGESAAGQQSGDVFDHEMDEEVTSLVSEHHRERSRQEHERRRSSAGGNEDAALSTAMETECEIRKSAEGILLLQRVMSEQLLLRRYHLKYLLLMGFQILQLQYKLNQNLL